MDKTIWDKINVDEILKNSNHSRILPIDIGRVSEHLKDFKPFYPLSDFTKDLKDEQRCWTIRAVLNSIPRGGHILEIGAGNPYMSEMLRRLGYSITVVDPYDGEGGGPTNFDEIKMNCPDIHFIRSLFGPECSRQLEGCLFDAVLSVSVLEHVPQENLSDIGLGIRQYLRPGGASIHAVDFPILGPGFERRCVHMDEVCEHIVFQENNSKKFALSMREELDLMVMPSHVFVHNYSKNNAIGQLVNKPVWQRWASINLVGEMGCE